MPDGIVADGGKSDSQDQLSREATIREPRDFVEQEAQPFTFDEAGLISAIWGLMAS